MAIRPPQMNLAVGVLALVAAVALAAGCSDSSGGGSGGGIHEKFTDPADRDAAGTTAAWSLDGVSGLHATHGFGGNGSDGALIVSGSVVLDSSAGSPAPPVWNKIAEWNLSRLVIEKGATLRLTGPRPVRLKVVGSCHIEGILDASGHHGVNAPGGQASEVGKIAGGAGGPGGGDGGTSNYYPNSHLATPPRYLVGWPGFPNGIYGCVPNHSSNMVRSTRPQDNCGGGNGGNRGTAAGSVLLNGCSGNGGGHATPGLPTDSLCRNIASYGAIYGWNWVQLTGPTHTKLPTSGTGGGAGGNAAIALGVPSATEDIVGGSGGGGGGAVEIECAGAIVVAAGGAIVVNGGNGGIGHSTLVGGTTVRGGYGGAGAGGSVWLSGTSVAVEPGATLSARGGLGNPSPPGPGAGGHGGDGYFIIRDLGGTPVVDGTITPTAPAERYRYEPAVNGTSQAVSRWYDGRHDSPAWSFDASDPQTGEVIPGDDLRFTTPPATGQTVYIDFQAAPDQNGAPHPDPLAWHPSGNTQQFPYSVWEPDLSRITASSGHRWLRFRVRFDLGALSKQQSLVNRIVIGSIRVRP